MFYITHLPPHVITFCVCCVVRTLQIYPLTNFKYTLQHCELWSLSCVLDPRAYSSCVAEVVHPWARMWRNRSPYTLLTAMQNGDALRKLVWQFLK